MQADVIIPIECKPSEIPTTSERTSIAAANEHADIQVKTKRKGRRWILLPLILTLCLATIITLKGVCRSKSGGIIHNCNYNCQPCSDSSGDPCPDICQESHYSEYCSSICETYESYWFIPVLIGFIILYLLECFLCYEWASQDKMDLNSFREYITKLKSTPPSITVHYESYHYKGTGKYYTVTVTVGRNYGNRGYGGRGYGQTQTQTRRVEYKEKVVTKTGSESFPFSSWEDNTEDISQMEDDWQRIFFCKTIKFKDEETRKSFRRWKKDVKSRNNGDTCFSMSTEFDIPGYIDRSLVSKETDARAPYCINRVVFWFLSFLLLTWPYRVYLEIVARLKNVKVIKVIKST